MPTSRRRYAKRPHPLLDQGSVGWSAAWYATGPLSLNLHIVPDAAHGCWNDWTLATKAVGLWPLVLVLTIVINSPWGPWHGAAFFEKMRGGLQGYLGRASGAQDPLFQSPLSGLCRDHKETGDPTDPAAQSMMWERFKTTQAGLPASPDSPPVTPD